MWSRAVEVRPHKPGLWRSSYVSYAPSYKGKVYSELVPKVVTFQLLSLHYTNPHVAPYSCKVIVVRIELAS